MFEVPVHFYSLSPAQVRRTTFADGVQRRGTIVWRRFAPASQSTRRRHGTSLPIRRRR